MVDLGPDTSQIMFVTMFLISERNRLLSLRQLKIKGFDVPGAQVERLVPVSKAIVYGSVAAFDCWSLSHNVSGR